MKVPPKRKGNQGNFSRESDTFAPLNESPSEKEGKLQRGRGLAQIRHSPSMKVPPKRKGNERTHHQNQTGDEPSMKVPPKRKGNHRSRRGRPSGYPTLNESPSEKEGKFVASKTADVFGGQPSMKVPPKRKGNHEDMVCRCVHL